MQLAPGTIVEERFRIERLMGCGGMGVVYRARQLNLDRPVALKFVNVFCTAETDATHRLEREAVVLSRLHHRHIVSFYGFGTYGSEHYLVLEYIEGNSLDDLLDNGKPLSWIHTLRIAEQIASALKHAHSLGIVHRDLKPANVLLTVEGEEEVVRLIDFGMAKLLPEFEKQLQRLTQTGSALGTILYMSPEQCIAAPIDHRADIYSLGAIMFHCLSGHPPFYGDIEEHLLTAHLAAPLPQLDSSDVPAELAPSLEAIIHRCMAKSPNDRYDSADELLEDLHKVQKLQPILLTPPHDSFSKFHHLVRQPSRTMRNLAVLAAASAVILIFGFFCSNTRRSRTPLTPDADETVGASDLFYQWRGKPHLPDATEIQKTKRILAKNRFDHSLDMNQAALDELYCSLARCYIEQGQQAEGWRYLKEGWELKLPGRPEPHSHGKKNILALELRISCQKMLDGEKPDTLMKTDGGFLREVEQESMSELENAVASEAADKETRSGTADEGLACVLIQFEHARGNQRAFNRALYLDNRLTGSVREIEGPEGWQYWGRKYLDRDPLWAETCLDRALRVSTRYDSEIDKGRFLSALGLDYSYLACSRHPGVPQKLWRRAAELLEQSSGNEPDRTIALALAYQSLGQGQRAAGCIDKILDPESGLKFGKNCWQSLHTYADILRAKGRKAELQGLLTKIADYKRQTHANVTVQI